MDFNLEQGWMILSASEQEIVDQYEAVEDYVERPMTYQDWDN